MFCGFLLTFQRSGMCTHIDFVILGVERIFYIGCCYLHDGMIVLFSDRMNSMVCTSQYITLWMFVWPTHMGNVSVWQMERCEVTVRQYMHALRQPVCVGIHRRLYTHTCSVFVWVLRTSFNNNNNNNRTILLLLRNVRFKERNCKIHYKKYSLGCDQKIYALNCVSFLWLPEAVEILYRKMHWMIAKAWSIRSENQR